MYNPDNEQREGPIGVSEARETFAELVNRVAYGHERVLVARRGRPIAAIVPIDDVEFIERIEDELDRQAAVEALDDPKNAETIPWERVKANLGL
jgi:prevent-host-death family protein